MMWRPALAEVEMERQAVIVSAVRTPIGKIRGVLAAIRPDDLAALVIRAAVEGAGVEPGEIEEVYLGLRQSSGGGQSQCGADGAVVGGFAAGGWRASPSTASAPAG